MKDYQDIYALADGQLEGEAKAAAEERLRTCQDSRLQYEAVQQLKVALADKCAEMTCATTWSRCQERIKQIDKARKTEAFVGKYSWGLCAAFLLTIVIAGSVNRSRGSFVRTGDVPRISASLSPLPFLGKSSEERRRFISEVMPQASVKPESVTVVNGASGTVNGHKVVKLNLLEGSSGVPMAFFLFENTARIEDAEAAAGRGFSVCNVNGTNGLGWSEGTNSYLLIGNRPLDELRVVAEAIRGK